MGVGGGCGGVGDREGVSDGGGEGGLNFNINPLKMTQSNQKKKNPFFYSKRAPSPSETEV